MRIEAEGGKGAGYRDFLLGVGLNRLTIDQVGANEYVSSLFFI